MFITSHIHVASFTQLFTEKYLTVHRNLNLILKHREFVTLPSKEDGNLSIFIVVGHLNSLLQAVCPL